MILIVDSGSTKCDWLSIDDNGNSIFEKQRTKGLNPAIISEEELDNRIRANKILVSNKEKVSHIYFYGAGCGTENPRLLLKGVLQNIFRNAEVSVKEDTYAAVYATIDNSNEKAIVCILGTGSNCSYYDGNRIQQRVDSLGYSIMDDASGNYFGRQLIRDYYFNHMPHDLKVSFAEKFNVDADFIKHSLYKEPNPNAYLASFAEFMFLNKDSEYISELIKNGIRLFTRNMIMQYDDLVSDVRVHFAGSIAYFSKDEIHEVGEELGFKVGNFARRPIEGLVKYHTQNL